MDGLAQSFWQVLLDAAVITHLNLIYFYFRRLPNNTKDFFPASHWNCVHIAMATMPEIFVVPDPFYWLLDICAINIYIYIAVFSHLSIPSAYFQVKYNQLAQPQLSRLPHGTG